MTYIATYGIDHGDLARHNGRAVSGTIYPICSEEHISFPHLTPNALYPLLQQKAEELTKNYFANPETGKIRVDLLRLVDEENAKILKIKPIHAHIDTGIHALQFVS